MTQKINFSYQVEMKPIKESSRLKDFIERMLTAEKRNLESLSIVLCSDTFLHQINLKYLAHDNLTDIITFDYTNSPGTINGEIYISIDRIKENADTFNQTIRREMHRVIFHGILHLCGYKDKLRDDQKLMRQKEDEYLTRYFSK